MLTDSEKEQLEALAEAYDFYIQNPEQGLSLSKGSFIMDNCFSSPIYAQQVMDTMTTGLTDIDADSESILDQPDDITESVIYQNAKKAYLLFDALKGKLAEAWQDPNATEQLNENLSTLYNIIVDTPFKQHRESLSNLLELDVFEPLENYSMSDIEIRDILYQKTGFERNPVADPGTDFNNFLNHIKENYGVDFSKTSTGLVKGLSQDISNGNYFTLAVALKFLPEMANDRPFEFLPQEGINPRSTVNSMADLKSAFVQDRFSKIDTSELGLSAEKDRELKDDFKQLSKRFAIVPDKDLFVKKCLADLNSNDTKKANKAKEFATAFDYCPMLRKNGNSYELVHQSLNDYFWGLAAAESKKVSSPAPSYPTASQQSAISNQQSITSSSAPKQHDNDTDQPDPPRSGPGGMGRR